jgi:hypothetical protein
MLCFVTLVSIQVRKEFLRIMKGMINEHISVTPRIFPPCLIGT